MFSPSKFVYIWRNGDIAHIIAYTQAQAGEYVYSKLGLFIDTAYIIRRTARKKDFADFNTVVLGGIKPCDVILEPLKNLGMIYSPTKPK
jgi:hypothetical protein